MLQRVCEKCGKVIPEPTRHNLIQYKIHYVPMAFHKTESEPACTVDLCDSCFDKFVDWLMAAPKEG